MCLIFIQCSTYHFLAAARVRHLIEEAQNSSAGSDDVDPAKLTQHDERRAEVRDAMDELSEQYRQALEWKYIDRMSVREIAQRWRTTEKAVESVLFRARGELRKRLLEKDSEAGAIAGRQKQKASKGKESAKQESASDETDEGKPQVIQSSVKEGVA